MAEDQGRWKDIVVELTTTEFVVEVLPDPEPVQPDPGTARSRSPPSSSGELMGGNV